MKHSLLLVLIIFVWPFLTYGQGAETDRLPLQTQLKKNSIFGNVGILPVVAASISISYDRSLFSTQNKTDYRAKLSIGFMGALGDTYSYQSLAAGLLTGKRNSHFELFGGAALYQYTPVKLPGGILPEDSSIGIFPVGNIGYRYQKPDGGFIFRAGVGFPDMGYVGLGVAF